MVEDIVVVLGMGGESGRLDSETMVVGSLEELFTILSLIYLRLLHGTLGGYYVDGVLACMNDVVLLTIDGVWRGD